MAIKEENSVVGIEYELTEAGKSEILDSNKGGAPLEFIIGKGQIIPGLEKGLVGMSEGDTADILVKAEDAYGLRDDEAVQQLPREQFEGIELEKGMSLYGQGQQGETIQVTVVDFDDNTVTVDFNHPLAGKDLMFNVKVVSERDATEQEAATGQVESSGCEGGSCGCGH
jgi:FKBP-type peptidyl-prolyl cis-trans isomerase SlyD